MITPFLERLIDAGCAQSLTFTCTGGQAIFKMPPGKHLVIHSFTSAPFIPLANGESFTDLAAVIRKSIMQLGISSKLSRNTFMIKQDVIGAPAAGGFTYFPINSRTCDTYLTHETDVFFEWLMPPDPRNWTQTTELTSGKANNPNKPSLGYGTAASGGAIPGLVSQSRIIYNNGTGSEYKNHNDFVASTNNVSFNQFNFPAANNTRLPIDFPFNDPQYMNTVPVLNVQMVLIDKNNAGKFKQSQ